MADNSFKINKSVNFNPQAGAPANPVDGDFFFDSVAQSFAYYHNGSWANFDSVGTVGTALWLTGAQFTPAIVRNSVVKVTGGVSTAHLAGISASFSAKQITIYNAGSALIVVEPEDANEPTANNRIQTPTAGSMNLVAGEVAVFTYDVVVNRWLLVSISSNAGAQVIATTTNPGLVTLHQASLFPLDGVVLSDGDLNTANGVVGLDSNRAATIAAPTAAVPALTITANVGSSAITSNGNIVFSGASRQVVWPSTSITEFAANTSRWVVNVAGTAYAQLYEAGAGDLELLLQPNGVTSLGFRLSATSNDIRSVGAIPLNLNVNGANRWQITSAGVLTSVSGPRAIQSVLNPVTAQDAATMDYVDVYRVPTNHVHNGRFDFWQRGLNITTTGARKFTADRWSIVCGSTTGNVVVSRPVGPDHCRYGVTVNRPEADTGTNTRFFTQEIDRDSVLLLRGKKVQLVFWAKRGATFSGASDALFVTVATGTVEAGVYAPSGYTGQALPISTQVTLTTSWQKFTAYASVAVGATAQAMAVAFSYSPTGTADVDDEFFISGVQLVDQSTISGVNAPNPTETFIYAGGSYAADLRECQRRYEKSYDLFTAPASAVNEGLERLHYAGTGPPQSWGNIYFRVPKRATPVVTLYAPDNTAGQWSHNGTNRAATANSAVGENSVEVVMTSGSPATGDILIGHWTAEAEI